MLVSGSLDGTLCVWKVTKKSCDCVVLDGKNFLGNFKNRIIKIIKFQTNN